MPSNRSAANQRLFFALWPEPAVRTALAYVLEKALPHGSKPVEVGNLHMTLAFLGSVDAGTRACLEKAAESIRAAPFSFTLDQLGYFHKTKVIWLGSSEVPSTLLGLAQELARIQLSCGLEPDSRPFQAHVTLARKATAGPREEQITPVLWPVREFVLVHSKTLPEGATYEVVHRWPLIASAES